MEINKANEDTCEKIEAKMHMKIDEVKNKLIDNKKKIDDQIKQDIWKDGQQTIKTGKLNEKGQLQQSKTGGLRQMEASMTSQ